jgi:hypothetical protein
MQPAKLNYKIYQGSTFEESFRWESQTKVYAPITSISKAAPCVITTQTLHSLPIGWRFLVIGAGGMKEINSTADNYYLATDTSSTTITINQVNSLLYTAYTTGGVVEYNQPVPLAGLKARMQFRKSVTSTDTLYEATTDTPQIVIDLALSTILVNIPASVTQSFQFTAAVYSLELYNDAGLVIPFLTGNVSVIPEITR